MPRSDFLIRNWDTVAFPRVFQAMRQFTDTRDPTAPDEIWCVEHPPVFTLGKACLRPPVANPDQIPTVPCDRGGDVTFHAPGQLVIYPLLNLVRRRLFVRTYVRLLEASVIQTLQDFGIQASTHDQAPGVYVRLPGGEGEFKNLAKIASLGVRVSRGCSYHGLAVNNTMDLHGFSYINPCGYSGLRMIRLLDLGVCVSRQSLQDHLLNHLIENLDNQNGR